MPRVLSLCLPTWPTDLARRRWRGEARDRAVVLVDRAGGRELVAAACARAWRAGVRPGMALAHARPLVGADRVAVGRHRPDRDAAALRALAEWALRVSPAVGVDPPCGLLIDVGGTERLYGREARVARSVCRALGRRGIAARAAVASTVACARAVSHFGAGRWAVVPEGRELEAVGPLPVGALRLEARCAQRLGEVGVDRVEQLMRLPRASLPARYGDGPGLALDRVAGAAWEWFEPVRPEPAMAVELPFEGATTHAESVWAACREAVDRLCARLGERRRGAREVTLTLARLGAGPRGGPESVTVRLSRASRDAGHVWSLLRPRVEGLHLGHGVEGVSLVAGRTARLRDEQLGADALGHEAERIDAARAAARTVDALANRLGADRVLRVELVGSHLPERAWRLRSSLEERPAEESAVTARARPTVLLRRPEPAEAVALVPEGPVLSLSWRGRSWRVVASRGPERIEPEWWRHAEGRERAARDYHALQLEDGTWVWACRELGGGRWFVHGVWA